MARIGYGRVSTADQHPEYQQDRLRGAGCAEPLFIDRGVSGTQARRPRWDKLLETLQPGDELVCTKLDRIARSVANLFDVTRDLEARNVGLIVLDQDINTTTPVGRLLFTILGAIAEFERDLIVERTRDGQQTVRRAGNLRRSLGGPPVLGFRDEGGADDRDWVIDPAAAGWLREAAERVVNGEPVEAVHAALPVMHDAAGRTVNAKMLRAALVRPASAGLITTDDGQEIPAVIGGPLDEVTHRRLVALFGSRKLGRPIETGRYWAGPLLRCAKCGNQLTGQPGYKGRPYYACHNPHKIDGVTIRPCKGVSVLAEDVHELIEDAVMVWTESPVARAAAALVSETGTATRRAELEARITEAQGWLADVEVKRLRRYITAERYAGLEAEITAQIDADAAELAALEEIDARPGLPGLGFEWDELIPAEKLALAAAAVQTPIVVRPGNGGGRALSAADRIDLMPAGLA
jgi:DNA invertase Pin-like site-specific DNA recombinase